MDAAVTSLLFACRICGLPLRSDTCGRCGANNVAMFWQGQRIDYRRGQNFGRPAATAQSPTLAVRQVNGTWREVEKVGTD